MGTTQSHSSDFVNFSAVHKIIVTAYSTSVLIHTMKIEDEQYLISKTLTASQEEDKINLWIAEHNFEQHIILYGYSHVDMTDLIQKKQKLRAYGFTNVFIYLGGMFEWLLLRDVYGEIEFPVTGLTKKSDFIDIMKYGKKIDLLKPLKQDK